MRIRKLRHGKRKVGDLTVERENVSALRDVSTKLVQSKWEGYTEEIPVDEREPIVKVNGVVAYPPDKTEKNIYCRIDLQGETLKVPGERFLWKLLQLL